MLCIAEGDANVLNTALFVADCYILEQKEVTVDTQTRHILCTNTAPVNCFLKYFLFVSLSLLSIAVGCLCF